jgi:Protein of unknown function (DUF2931)
MKTKKIIFTLLILILVSCKESNAQKKDIKTMENKDNYVWSATITNPDGFAVEIHEGYIADDKQPIASFVNTGTINQSWNYESDGVTGGNIVPTNFSLTWLGYADKKFWKAQGKLPSDVILALFRKGYMHTEYKTRSKITYKHICFGLTPGGMVVVWLTGLDQRVEIATFQAKETLVNVNDFCRNALELSQQGLYDYSFNHLPEETQAEIKTHGLPIGKWEKYRKKYNYRFVSQHYKPTVKERFDRRTKYYNGEEETLQEGELLLYKQRAIPYKAKFYYMDDGLNGGNITFDDQEMMQVFETISKKHPNEPFDIIAKVGFEYRDMTFTVKCGEDSIPLEKVKIDNMFRGIKD